MPLAKHKNPPFSLQNTKTTHTFFAKGMQFSRHGVYLLLLIAFLVFATWRGIAFSTIFFKTHLVSLITREGNKLTIRLFV
jgi:hypothetical protein